MGSTSTGRKPQVRLSNYVSWFEIPAYNIHRAAAFYNAIYGIEMEVEVNGDFAMAYFPAASGVGGAIIAGPGCFPSDVGTLVYLNAGTELEAILGRVEMAGGRVIMAKSLISAEAGYFALFIDSEGNRLALHQAAAPKAKAKPAARKSAVSKEPKAAKKAAATRKRS